MSNLIGTAFRVATFGESHGVEIGAVIDGCPARLPLAESDIQPQLDRRRPGQSAITTQRKESDHVKILSGVEAGSTTGAPICVAIKNMDQRPGDYDELRTVPRPSHADFTYKLKYGSAPRSGGGRASARETVARVAAGAIAEKLLLERHGIEIVAWVDSVGGICAASVDAESISRGEVDVSDVRCPDRVSASKMEEAILSAKEAGDSLGGSVTCVCRNVPGGWGAPVFDKAEALMARAMMSIPATKGFEIGSGFSAAAMKGSEHNDPFVMKNGRLGTATNNSGGVQGGITNGENIIFRVAFKPVSTIRIEQKTVDYDGNEVFLKPSKGRHDPCVLPRAVPIVEAMAAIVLADLSLLAGRG